MKNKNQVFQSASRCLGALVLLTVLMLQTGRVSAQGLSDKPNAHQIEQINRGYGMFMHFGVNTFNEEEWSNGKLPASSYNPTELDCDQWARVAKEAGFRYIILVTKHHDGFCLWDSKFTDYDVASSPVKTDVVGELAKACKKYGIELGLYYSLWDRHEPTHNDKDPQLYVDYMKNQLTELLTNYGKIIEIWFDGGWAKNDEDWMIPEVYEHIKKLQPSCQVTVNHTIRIPGTKTGIRQPMDYVEGDPIRFFPVDFRTKDPNMARWDDPKLYEFEGKNYYLNFEHTICLSDRWNWFQKKEMLPVRELDELEELFYWCTANRNILIVNLPPDETGKIRQHEADRVIELADRLGIRGGSKTFPTGPRNTTFNKPVEATSANEKTPAKLANDFSIETAWVTDSATASITIDLEETVRFDRIALFEYFTLKDLGDGFSILHVFGTKSFTVEAFNNDKWETIYVGSTIGACKILQFPSLKTASKIRVNILEADSATGFFHISVSDSSTKGVREVLKVKK